MQKFSNQASLAYNDIITNSNVVYAKYNANLSIEKTAGQESYDAGDTICFFVHLVNSGAQDQNNLTLHNDLGAYRHSSGMLVPLDYVEGSLRHYINGEEQDAPDIDCSAGLRIRGLCVPGGGNALLVYSATANAHAPLGGCASITNAATINGGCCGEPLRDSVTIENSVSPRLTISKSVCPPEISCDEELTYTILIQNNSSTAVVATDNVLVTDAFDPRLQITRVRFNGEDWSSPANYSYNSITGLFTTAAAQITVPAATFSQNMTTGVWTVTPGVSTLTITGSIRPCGCDCDCAD